jgi:hypothetical protein
MCNGGGFGPKDGVKTYMGPDMADTTTIKIKYFVFSQEVNSFLEILCSSLTDEISIIENPP